MNLTTSGVTPWAGGLLRPPSRGAAPSPSCFARASGCGSTFEHPIDPTVVAAATFRKSFRVTRIGIPSSAAPSPRGVGALHGRVAGRSFIHAAVLDDANDVAEIADADERVAVHDDDVGQLAFRNRP